jgi:hypothetical protein
VTASSEPTTAAARQRRLTYRINPVRDALIIAGIALGLFAGIFLSIMVIIWRKDRSDFARQHANELRIAVFGYKHEYKVVPHIVDSDTRPIESRGELLAILKAEHPGKNPESLRYWDPSPPQPFGQGARRDAHGEWELRDDWGRLFRVQMDIDGDGKIPNPAKGLGEQPDAIEAEAIVYSAGKDGDFGTWEDNIRTWY